MCVRVCVCVRARERGRKGKAFVWSLSIAISPPLREKSCFPPQGKHDACGMPLPEWPLINQTRRDLISTCFTGVFEKRLF